MTMVGNFTLINIFIAFFLADLWFC